MAGQILLCLLLGYYHHDDRWLWGHPAWQPSRSYHYHLYGDVQLYFIRIQHFVNRPLDFAAEREGLNRQQENSHFRQDGEVKKGVA